MEDSPSVISFLLFLYSPLNSCTESSHSSATLAASIMNVGIWDAELAWLFTAALIASLGPVRKPTLIPVIAQDFDQPLTTMVLSIPPGIVDGET